MYWWRWHYHVKDIAPFGLVFCGIQRRHTHRFQGVNYCGYQHVLILLFIIIIFFILKRKKWCRRISLQTCNRDTFLLIHVTAFYFIIFTINICRHLDTRDNLFLQACYYTSLWHKRRSQKIKWPNIIHFINLIICICLSTASAEYSKIQGKSFSY